MTWKINVKLHKPLEDKNNEKYFGNKIDFLMMHSTVMQPDQFSRRSPSRALIAIYILGIQPEVQFNSSFNYFSFKYVYCLTSLFSLSVYKGKTISENKREMEELISLIMQSLDTHTVHVCKWKTKVS